MALTGLACRHDVRSRHRWLNRFQTALLVLTLVGIAAAAGSLLFGEIGLWLALATCALTLLIEPAAASVMTLRLYGARPLHYQEAPRNLVAVAGVGRTHRITEYAGSPLCAQRHRQRFCYWFATPCLYCPH